MELRNEANYYRVWIVVPLQRNFHHRFSTANPDCSRSSERGGSDDQRHNCSI